MINYSKFQLELCCLAHLDWVYVLRTILMGTKASTIGRLDIKTENHCHIIRNMSMVSASLTVQSYWAATPLTFWSWLLQSSRKVFSSRTGN